MWSLLFTKLLLFAVGDHPPRMLKTKYTPMYARILSTPNGNIEAARAGQVRDFGAGRGKLFHRQKHLYNPAAMKIPTDMLELSHAAIWIFFVAIYIVCPVIPQPTVALFDPSTSL
jgi:hypothetical protein